MSSCSARKKLSRISDRIVYQIHFCWLEIDDQFNSIYLVLVSTFSMVSSELTPITNMILRKVI